MAQYKIVYTETVRHVFIADAENEAEALEVFEKGVESGKFDFSEGGVIDTDTTAQKIT